MARVDDAHRHLAELNDLYVSTVETLALAIDAKDQVTHGHIRRVQERAVELARRIGVTDPMERKAIEAAALLHDLGKLAIPEHILNKPGKLTRVEFDQMKLHASIGASIVSRINFPYPVAPVVRHHHENWDGTGYPDGLSGDAIPLGARILSVVDCFDALTSDRPYRRALSNADAAAILVERRGTMYDPQLVDAFLEMQTTFAAEDAADPDRHTNPLSDVVRLPVVEEPTEARPVVSRPLLVAPDAWQLTDSGARARAISAAVVARFTGVSPVVFEHDDVSGTLRPAAVWDGAPAVIGEQQVALGERMSGWVGANRRTICNSDPALDLAPFGDQAPAFQSSLCTPLLVGGSLAGVLTLYAPTPQRFSTDDLHTVEAAADALAMILLGRDPAALGAPQTATGIAPAQALARMSA